MWDHPSMCFWRESMSVVYDNEEFFTAYGQMDRSRGGL